MVPVAYQGTPQVEFNRDSTSLAFAIGVNVRKPWGLLVPTILNLLGARKGGGSKSFYPVGECSHKNGTARALLTGR